MLGMGLVRPFCITCVIINRKLLVGPWPYQPYWSLRLCSGVAEVNIRILAIYYLLGMNRMMTSKGVTR